MRETVVRDCFVVRERECGRDYIWIKERVCIIAISIIFVTAKVLLLQTCVCCDKHVLIMTKYIFCHSKNMLVVTKFYCNKYLSQQTCICMTKVLS